MDKAIENPYHFAHYKVNYIRYGDFTLFFILMVLQQQLKRKYPDPVNTQETRNFVLDDKNKGLLQEMYVDQCKNKNTENYPGFIVDQIGRKYKRHPLRSFTMWNIAINFVCKSYCKRNL